MSSTSVSSNTRFSSAPIITEATVKGESFWSCGRLCLTQNKTELQTQTSEGPKAHAELKVANNFERLFGRAQNIKVFGDVYPVTKKSLNNFLDETAKEIDQIVNAHPVSSRRSSNLSSLSERDVTVVSMSDMTNSSKLRDSISKAYDAVKEGKADIFPEIRSLSSTKKQQTTLDNIYNIFNIQEESSSSKKDYSFSRPDQFNEILRMRVFVQLNKDNFTQKRTSVSGWTAVDIPDVPERAEKKAEPTVSSYSLAYKTGVVAATALITCLAYTQGLF